KRAMTRRDRREHANRTRVRAPPSTGRRGEGGRGRGKEEEEEEEEEVEVGARMRTYIYICVMVWSVQIPRLAKPSRRRPMLLKSSPRPYSSNSRRTRSTTRAVVLA